MRMSKESNSSRFKRRPLTEDDRAIWADAQDRRYSPGKISTREEAAAIIKKIDPLRWFFMQRDRRWVASNPTKRDPLRSWFMKRDTAWVQKQMVRLGLNPEDVEWLLDASS